MSFLLSPRMSNSIQKLGLIAITFPKCSGKRFAVKKAAKPPWPAPTKQDSVALGIVR